MGLPVLDHDKYSLTVLNDAEILDSQSFLSAMLTHVVNGGTLQSFYRLNSKESFGKGFICSTRLRLTLSLGEVDSVGVVALRSAYIRARQGFIESKFDELFDIFDGDNIIEDPRLASAAKGKSDNIKWCLSKMKPQEYGDKIQIEQTVDVTIIDRLQAGRERAALLDSDEESNER